MRAKARLSFVRRRAASLVAECRFGIPPFLEDSQQSELGSRTFPVQGRLVRDLPWLPFGDEVHQRSMLHHPRRRFVEVLLPIPVNPICVTPLSHQQRVEAGQHHDGVPKSLVDPIHLARIAAPTPTTSIQDAFEVFVEKVVPGVDYHGASTLYEGLLQPIRPRCCNLHGKIGKVKEIVHVPKRICIHIEIDDAVVVEQFSNTQF
mmetsp:Transcript_145268/g.464127  ORF Transcript_145268/g.464127 Transcript_145268/m.464127 type:complete len:204 (-) Transcript_145268:947-1558(-)